MCLYKKKARSGGMASPPGLTAGFKPMPSGYRKGESRVPQCDGGKRLPPRLPVWRSHATLKVGAGYFQHGCLM